MKTGKRFLSIGLVLPLALVLAACGNPGSAAQSDDNGDATASVIDELNGAPHDQQRDKAIELAKKEGSLSLYSGASEDTSQALADAFTKKFGIHVNVFRASSETVVQRVIQESGANRLGADAVFLSFGSIVDVAEQDILADYTGAGLDGLGKNAIHDGWTAASGYLYVPVWNTDVIPAGQEPRSWADLADPRFDGKLTLESSDSDWFGAVSTYWKQQGKSQAEIDDLWSKIVDGAHVASGHSAMMQLLGAGQTGVNAVNYDYIAQQSQDQGAPVAYRSADGIVHTPAFVYPFGIGLFSGAKHPAAAWLFYDWLLQEGQKTLGDYDLLSAHEVAGDEKAKGETLVLFPDSVISDTKDWQAKYDALLRGVPTQPKS